MKIFKSLLVVILLFSVFGILQRVNQHAKTMKYFKEEK